MSLWRRREAVLAAIHQVVTQGEYDSAGLYAVQKALALPSEPFEAARGLHHLGWISLQQRPGPRGTFWVARPFDAPRRVYATDLETVRARIEVVVREAKSGRHAFYDTVRDRFAWMTPRGTDTLLPILQQLAVEGLLTLARRTSQATVS